MDVWVSYVRDRLEGLSFHGSSHKPAGKPILWRPLLWHSGEGKGGGLGEKKSCSVPDMLVPAVGFWCKWVVFLFFFHLLPLFE